MSEPEESRHEIHGPSLCIVASLLASHLDMFGRGQDLSTLFEDCVVRATRAELEALTFLREKSLPGAECSAAKGGGAAGHPPAAEPNARNSSSFAYGPKDLGGDGAGRQAH